MRGRCLLFVLTLTMAGCDSAMTGSVDRGGAGGPPSTAAASDEDIAKAAIAASSAVGQAVAAILPVKDLQAIYENGRPRPSCPDMSVEFEASTASLRLEYGSGCAPDAFEAARFAGRVSGTTKISYNGIKYELDGFSAQGAGLNGAIAGGFRANGSRTEFTLSVTLRLGDGAKVRGSATVAHDESDSSLELSEARLSMTPPDGVAQQVTLKGARIEAAGRGSFVPSSGAIEVAVREGDAGAARRFEFTASTPIDGTVISR